MKILVSDFDKTLYTENYKENVELVNDFVNQGNMFIIATGRNLPSLLPDLDKDLKYDYLICNNGGIIFDSNLKVIYRKDIDNGEDIFNLLKKTPCVGNPLVDSAYEYFDYAISPCNAIIARIINYDNTKKLLKYILDKYPFISGYLSDRWLNIDSFNVSKGNGIKYICDKLNYDYHDVYAVGDGLNDVPMLEICNGYVIKSDRLDLTNTSNKVINDIKELLVYLNTTSK